MKKAGNDNTKQRIANVIIQVTDCQHCPLSKHGGFKMQGPLDLFCKANTKKLKADNIGDYPVPKTCPFLKGKYIWNSDATIGNELQKQEEV